MSYEQSKAFESLQYLGAFLFNRKQFNGSHFHILKCNKNLFLKRMITGNEKDCLQCGVKKVLGENKMSHHLIALKACLHLKKVLLCIWWDWNGICKRFLQNQTNSDKHCPQLDQLKTTCNEMSWNGQLEKVSFRLGQGQISYLCRPYRNRAWLRCPTALALFTWPCAFILPLILIHTKFS